MNTQQPTNEHNPSNTPSCPHCHAQLRPHSLFCSSCGERIEENEERVNGEDVTLRQHKVSLSLQSELLPSLPATPIPLTSETLQKIPETEIPAWPLEELNVPSTPLPGIDTNELPIFQPVRQRVTRPLSTVASIPQRKVAWSLSGSDRLWPTIIILSALAAGLVNFVFTGIGIRPIIVFWFLFVCPGMILVRFLRLKEPVVEWTLAIVLSFAIEATVAGIQLYVGKWSPTGTLNILIVLSLVGAVVQLAPMGSITIFIPKQLRILHSSKLRVPSAISLAWVKRFWEVQWSPWRLRSLISSGVRSATLRRPNVSKPESLIAQLATVAVPKRWRASRAWKAGIVFIFLALFIGLGVVAGFWSHVPSHSAIPRPNVTTLASRPTPTPTPVPTIYPLITGTYNGTIADLSSNVSTRLSLTEVRQSQGKMSGYLILGSRLQGSGPFSGTIGTAKHFQFTVTDAVGHATFFFEGAIQSATSLSGVYYQCSPNPTQNSECIRTSGGYGIWNVVLTS